MRRTSAYACAWFLFCDMFVCVVQYEKDLGVCVTAASTVPYVLS